MRRARPEDAAELTRIAHAAKRRPHTGAGLGALLFRHACEEAARLGARTLEIVSDPNAAGFYRKMGAVRRGEAPSVPAGRVLPVLVLDLTRARERAPSRLSSGRREGG